MFSSTFLDLLIAALHILDTSLDLCFRPVVLVSHRSANGPWICRLLCHKIYQIRILLGTRKRERSERERSEIDCHMSQLNLNISRGLPLNSNEAIRERLICLCGHHMWEHGFYKDKATQCIGWVKREKKTCICTSFVPKKYVIIDGKTNGPATGRDALV